MQNHISIKSTLESLHLVEKFVDEAAVKYNFSNEIYGNILMATLEAANNAIFHGNQNDVNKFVEIEIHRNKNEMEFIITDEGLGFDFRDIPDPTAPDNIEKINGRGIFLMKKLSDKLEFIEKGRIVKLTFKLK